MSTTFKFFESLASLIPARNSHTALFFSRLLASENKTIHLCLIKMDLI